ncbi:cytochrome C oxidase subunit II [Salipaludibacillus sp. CF4.18]|uniref:cytochrome C oxidase subunit II n=1 Tax=Salipaludibacillus sp. CF4.18 TaxID=3373081 RepID=UPI003EE71E0A
MGCKVFTVITSAILLLTLVGCGGNENAPSSGGNEVSSEVTIERVNWEFDSDTYTIPSGEAVAINYVNGEGNHGIKIIGTDVDIEDGESATVNLEPGEYKMQYHVRSRSR